MLAILIGVREYKWYNGLQWTDRDVVLVEETLKQYCGCQPNDIVLMTDTLAAARQPIRKNILRVLDQELSRANQQGYDRVLVYFAGHGISKEESGQQQRLYLAPQDYNELNLATTGIPISVVRDALKKCSRIPTKFLILDTCHAGSTRGASASPSVAIAAQIRETQGLLTLASCQADEQSLELPDFRQGLFTYWFCQGLAGAADLEPFGNGDLTVDTVELEGFVRDKVRDSARTLYRSQNPMAIPSHGWNGRASLAYLSGDASQRQDAQRRWTSVEQARLYRDGGFLAEALESLEKAFRSNPSEEELRDLYALRGRFHVERGKLHQDGQRLPASVGEFEAAVKDLNEAIERHQPPSPPSQLAVFHAWRCEAYYGLKQFDRALEDATKVVELRADLPVAHRNRATVYRAMSDGQAADQDLRTAAGLPGAGQPPEVAPIPAIPAPVP